MSSNIKNYSTLDNEHNLEDLYIQLQNQQTYTSEHHNHIKGSPIFNPVFCICLIVDLLMQHEFCCVNLIGRSWRTQKKRTKTTPTYLSHTYSLLEVRSIAQDGVGPRAVWGDNLAAKRKQTEKGHDMWVTAGQEEYIRFVILKGIPGMCKAPAPQYTLVFWICFGFVAAT